MRMFISELVEYSRKQATSYAPGRTHLRSSLGSTLTALSAAEDRPSDLCLKLLRKALKGLSDTRNVVASAPEWEGTLRQGNRVAHKAYSLWFKLRNTGARSRRRGRSALSKIGILPHTRRQRPSEPL